MKPLSPHQPAPDAEPNRHGEIRVPHELAPHHRDYLISRGVADEVAAERGYRSVVTKAELQTLGFGVNQRRGGLVIPTWGTTPTPAPLVYQLRPDEPRRNSEGRLRRFELPRGAGMHLDVHPRMLPLVGSTAVPLVVTDGVIRGDSAVSILDVCTISLVGPWDWPGPKSRTGKADLADSPYLAVDDRDVLIVFGSDLAQQPSVEAAMRRLGALLEQRRARVRVTHLPAGEDGAKVGLDDWLVAGAGVEPSDLLDALTQMSIPLDGDRPQRRRSSRPAPPPPSRLADVDNVFSRWLEEPDLQAVHIVLGAVAANRGPGDPVWLLIVAPPSSGKTEALMALAGLDDVTLVGRLTVAALLSGAAASGWADDATGGVLRVIGRQGILVCKDFGSILAMPRDARAEVLQALRDVYDGHYSRDVGTSGGRHLEWSGHCGFIGGTTESIDRHHAVIAAMGDRYVSVRLSLADPDRQAVRAVDGHGDEARMRVELAESVAGLLGHPNATSPALHTDVVDHVASMATLAVRCRSVVERGGYSRDIIAVPTPEQPARIAKQLAALFGGLLTIGCSHAEAWAAVGRVALDSMPAGRRQVLELLAAHAAEIGTSAIGEALRLPTTAVRRHLEELEVHGVVDRSGVAEGTHRWLMSDWCRQRWPSVPETSARVHPGDRGYSAPSHVHQHPTG